VIVVCGWYRESKCISAAHGTGPGRSGERSTGRLYCALAYPTPMPSSLPLLALAAPRVLLPTARISVPVDKQTAIAAHALFQAAPDGHALVAAVPALAAPIADNEGLTPSDDTSGPVSLAKWGTVARITRVLKSAVARGKGATYFVFLAGTGTRVRILQAETSTSEDSLPSIAVEYVKDSSQPAREIVEAFRSAAAALLDRLARDPAQQSRRDAWQRLADALEGLSSSNALSTADALLSALGIDHPDQLGQSSIPLIPLV
jgi:ATP-dependent Lon protease